VASGSGIVVVPMSVARLHHRKDVVHRPVTGVAASRVGLAWRADDEDPRIEDFIGIVRGRTERSTRGAADASAPAKADPAGKAHRSGTSPARVQRSTPRRGQPAGRKGAPRGGASRRKGRR
jgi:hypothetical protein